MSSSGLTDALFVHDKIAGHLDLTLHDRPVGNSLHAGLSCDATNAHAGTVMRQPIMCSCDFSTACNSTKQSSDNHKLKIHVSLQAPLEISDEIVSSSMLSTTIHPNETFNL